VITLFGKVLGRNNRLYLAYQEDWSRWWPAARYGDRFPDFDDWKAAPGGACLLCIANETYSFPIDPAYHEWRTGHAPLARKETSYVQ
jgi:hypothetical protein